MQLKNIFYRYWISGRGKQKLKAQIRAQIACDLRDIRKVKRYKPIGGRHYGLNAVETQTRCVRTIG